MTTNQYIDGTYLDKVADWHVGDSLWKASKVFHIIEKHQLSPKSIYDVGCGAGEILVELQKKMNAEVELCGFDISPQAISISKPKGNGKLKFYNEDFLTAAISPPDLLLLLDVFEHVSDYIGFLNILRKKSDWIIFHIPLDICAKAVLRKSNYLLYMRQKYGHLHYFTKETAIATLSDIGFNIVDYFYTDDMEITGEVPRGLRSRTVCEVRKRLFRINQDFAVSFFNSFNLMVLARGDLETHSISFQ